MDIIPFAQIVETLAYIAIGAGMAYPLLLLNIKVAPALGMIDWPKARGVTEDQIPIVGHSLVLLSVVGLFVFTQLNYVSNWVLVTSVIMAVMGYIDDRRPLSALDKLFFQVVCATAVVFLDPQIQNAITDKYGSLGTGLAILFIVALVNAVNFIDGIDGLAGLVIFMGALGFIGFSHSSPKNFPFYLYSSLLMGMLIPFLYFNVAKRKGFMGNVGSYFFSYLLAVMHLSIPLQAGHAIPRVSLSALCFLIPMADSIMVVMTRLLTLRSPFQADKGHLHHRLIQTSIPLRYVLMNFALIELAGVAIAKLLNRNHLSGESFLLPSYVCFSYVGISAILILMVEKASKRRVQHYFQRLDSGQPIYFMKYQIKKTNGTPISRHTLRRLEARISAEIRVTDMCFAENPDTIFVTVATMSEPLRGISARLESVFEKEGVTTTLVVDQGEFLKVSRQPYAKEPIAGNSKR